MELLLLLFRNYPSEARDAGDGGSGARHFGATEEER